MSGRVTRGISSSFAIFGNPIAKWFAYQLAPFRTPERKEQGCILVLPGIESYSFLNRSIAWGLIDAGISQSIEIHDWTTGRDLLLLFHLCSWKRNLRQAQLLADKIVRYQDAFPGRPVTLIGHSGGGAIALLAVEALPEGREVDRVILLAPAISPEFRLTKVLKRTEVWNYSSLFDWFFLGLGTLVFGTIDRRHRLAAGAIGFQIPPDLEQEEVELYETRLHETPYELKMASSFNFGGHIGCTNRVFAAEVLSTLIPPARPAEEHIGTRISTAS